MRRVAIQHSAFLILFVAIVDYISIGMKDEVHRRVGRRRPWETPIQTLR